MTKAKEDDSKGMSRAAQKRLKKKQKLTDCRTDRREVDDSTHSKDDTTIKTLSLQNTSKKARKEKEFESVNVKDVETNDDICSVDDGSDSDGDKMYAPLLEGCTVSVIPPPKFSQIKDLIAIDNQDMSEEMTDFLNSLTTRQLAECVLHFILEPSGLTTTEFYAEFWEKKPLLVQVASNKDKHSHSQRFNGLLSLQGIKETIETHTTFYGKDLNVTRYEKADDGVKRRKTLDPAPTGNDADYAKVIPAELWKSYENGCTIRLLCPHKHSSNTHSLLSLLESEWGCMVGANAYLTPPGASQGFAPHFDDIEAFCLQLEGRKRWKVYAPRTKQERLPRTSSEDFTENDMEDIKPVLDVVLEAGDMLYMPRGWIHQACTLPGQESEDGHSLHLTVSCMQQWAWCDLLETLIPEALHAVASEDSTILRQGLPPRFLEYTGAMHDNDDDKLPEVLKKKLKEAASDAAIDPTLAEKQRLKELFRSEAKRRITRVAKEAIDMLDAACDQMGKRFLAERLPPALSKKESAGTDQGRSEAFKLLPNVLCRIVRPGIARLVLEDGKAVLYQCVDNSKVFLENPLSPMEFELDDGPAIEQLLTTCEPHWILVSDLIHDSIEDKIGVAQALYDEGILAVHSP
jgi:lysine-specific demethylase/histidyl-hydroxylase NO66